MQPDWLAEEPGAIDATRQLSRLYRRAWRRKWLVLGLAVAAALSIVGLLSMKDYKFAPRVVLRAIEADHEYRAAPRPKKRLREHVRDAVFSSQRLSEVMKKYRLYPALAQNNPQAAIGLFRDDITIDVYRNYFVEERMARDTTRAPRSARIAISYRSSDRKIALNVARDLAALVAEHESSTRREQVSAAIDRSSRELARARASLIEHRRLIAKKTLDAQANPDPQLMVEIANLQRSLGALERRVTDAQTIKAGLEVNRSLEQGQLGLRFELVDRGAIAASAGIDLNDLVWIGCLTFLFGLPLIGLLVGAFDTRIRDAEDLQRLGVSVLGQVRTSLPRTSLPRAEGYA